MKMDAEVSRSALDLEREKVRAETWRVRATHDEVADVKTGGLILDAASGDGWLTNAARAELASAAPEMYRALKDVEWAARDGEDLDVAECPLCLGLRPGQFEGLIEGHNAACTLAAALRKAEGWRAA